MRRLTPKGTIPEVASTYHYLNVAYPAMNEKGLAIELIGELVKQYGTVTAASA